MVLYGANKPTFLDSDRVKDFLDKLSRRRCRQIHKVGQVPPEVVKRILRSLWYLAPFERLEEVMIRLVFEDWKCFGRRMGFLI